MQPNQSLGISYSLLKTCNKIVKLLETRLLQFQLQNGYKVVYFYMIRGIIKVIIMASIVPYCHFKSLKLNTSMLNLCLGFLVDAQFSVQ